MSYRIYFKEAIKPMVVNATNGKIIKSFANSAFVEDWNNIVVELYVDENVKSVSGGTTQGVRIRPVQPKVNTKPLFSFDNFEKAKKAKATKEQIEKIYTLTEDVYNEFLIYEPTT
jgi:hypothetical protein